jgi:dihydrodiol dehydrogenase / D-xylose 1-dehydrogenase (NADP)
MWTRFFPAMEHVKSLIASGEIGNVVNVQGDFGWNNSECPYPSDRIWNPSSGGMTLDIGMYMAQLGQVAYPFADVSQVQAMATMKNGVDQTILANIMYENEQQGGNVGGENGMLQFYVTGAANTEERVTIQGSKGRIVLDSPAHCPQKVRLFRDIGRGSSTEEVFDFPLPDDSFTTWNYPGSIGFSYQIKSVCEALKRGEKECKQFTWNDSIQLASVMDEILAQARNPNKLNSKKVAFIPEEVPTAMLN